MSPRHIVPFFIVSFFEPTCAISPAGANDVEFARADLVAENVAETLGKYFSFRFTEDPTAKAAAMKVFKETTLPNFLKMNAAYYSRNGGKFATGAAVRSKINQTPHLMLPMSIQE